MSSLRLLGEESSDLNTDVRIQITLGHRQLAKFTRQLPIMESSLSQ